MRLIKSDRTGDYKVRIITEHGHRTINTGVKSREEAISIIREARVPQLERAARTVRLTNEVVQQLRFGKAIRSIDAVAKWEEHLSLYARSSKTTLNKLTTVRAWLKAKHLNDTPAHVLKPSHIDTWINDTSSKTKAGTRAFKLSCIKAFFAWCASQQFTLGDPTLDLHVRMDSLRHSQKEPKKHGAFTDEEFDALMRHCAAWVAALEKERDSIIERLAAADAQGGHTGALAGLLSGIAEAMRKNSFWRLAALIGRHTGLRLGDVCRLELASLNDPGRLIVWTGKTDKRVSLPLPEALQFALNAWPRTDGVFLFPAQAAVYNDVRKRAVLSVTFGRLCAAAGVHGRGFHCLRRAFAQACRAAGIPTPHISEKLGHSSETTTEIYLA